MAAEHKMKRLRISDIQYAENMYSIDDLDVNKFETILPCYFKYGNIVGLVKFSCFIKSHVAC
jgi:hypothetical protein